MEEFLKNFQLSDNAIKLYFKCIGQQPLSSDELYSLLPNISKEEFNNILGDLIENGLFIPNSNQNKSLILHYLTIPPIKPILNYYTNINNNLTTIKSQLQLLLSNSLAKIFQDNQIIELNTMYDATQELRKDVEEDVIIQKQDIDDIVKGMENLLIIKDVLENLRQTIKGVTQTQFSSLIKLITNIKNEIFSKIESLELKKSEIAVKEIVEEAFKENFNKLLGDFTTNLHVLIGDEFNNTIESLNNILNSTFRYRDDFQMVLLNMLSTNEKRIKQIIELIKTKKTGLESDLKEFEKIIIDNFAEIIGKAVDSVASLNEPINATLDSYFNSINESMELESDNFWQIKSIARVKEEISNIVSHSTQNLLLVVPKLEENLSFDDIKDNPSTIKIQIASSEAHTNSLVKKYKILKNFEYRILKNENVIICRGDDDSLVIGIIDMESNNAKDNFIGFASKNKSLIKLFQYVVKAIWDIGSSSLQETPRTLNITVPKSSSVSKTLIATKTSKPVRPSPIKTLLKTTPIPITKKRVNNQAEKQKTKSSEGKIEHLAEELNKKIKEPKKLRESEEPAKVDESGIVINNAFKTLINKLHKLKGDEFSKEMAIISDLILEKKGFSVTLHKIRSKINQYKNHLSHLNNVDIKHIIESIEEWKEHIL
ncbi:MAG: hypothetical protein KGD72_11280 [Candidatus Lokiarchaeota archaeon]|nr:hypothetical protein [Candidatus Lokiarchaeota archaeon]